MLKKLNKITQPLSRRSMSLSSMAPSFSGALKEIQKAAKEGKSQLDLSERKLKELPSDLCLITQLLWLKVSNNELDTLPDDIVFLEKLQWFDLSHNAFRHFPAPLVHLASLTELNLQENDLTALPTEIAGLASLEKLTLKRNKLNALPDEIGRLLNLKELDVSQNELVVIPTTLGDASKLTVINFSDNKIAVLPHQLGQLHRLRILDVRNNPLELPPLKVAEKGLQAILTFLRESGEGTSHCAPDQTSAKGEGLSAAVIGKEATFIIEARDTTGAQIQTGGLDFIVTVTNFSNNVPLDATIKDNNDGTYRVSFIALRQGDYFIKVQLDGAHILGSPFVCAARDASSNIRPDASHSYALGDGLRTGVCGVPCKFTLFAKTTNDLPAAVSELPFKVSVLTVSNSSRTVPTISKGNAPASWDVQFIPKLMGEHIITVTLAGAAIKDAPFCCVVSSSTPNSSRPSSAAGLNRLKPPRLSTASIVSVEAPASPRVFTAIEREDSAPDLTIALNEVSLLKQNWQALDGPSADETAKLIDDLFAEIRDDSGPKSILEEAVVIRKPNSKIDLDGYEKAMATLNSIFSQLNQAIASGDQAKISSLLTQRNNARIECANYLNAARNAINNTSESKITTANWNSVYRFFIDAADALSRVPAPEKIAKMMNQLNEVRAKKRDMARQLRVLSGQHEKMARTERIGSTALAALANQLVSNQKTQQALRQKEQEFLDQLQHLADSDYPELRLQMKELDLTPSPVVVPGVVIVVGDGSSGSSKNNVVGILEERGFSSITAINRNQTVFLATSSNGDKCAIKTFALNAANINAQIQSLQRLVTFLKSHSHSCLCKVNSLFIEGTTAFLEMPFYAGPTLGEWIPENIYAVPIDVIRVIFAQILQCLNLLHNAGFVHGYLSPDAILIVEGSQKFGETTFNAVLCGFNPLPRDTSTKTIVDPYEAPEVAEGLLCTGSDMWSFGAILCESFSEAHLLPRLKAKKLTFPPIHSRLNSGNTLLSLLRRLLHKHPYRRPTAPAVLLSSYFMQGFLQAPIDDPRSSFSFEQRLKDAAQRIQTFSKASRGVLLLELEPSSSVPLGITLLEAIENLTEIELSQRWVLSVRGVPELSSSIAIIQAAIISLCEDQFDESLFETPVNNVLSHWSKGSKTNAFYLPNAKCKDLRLLKLFGKLLAACLRSSYPLPRCFPSLFYRALLSADTIQPPPSPLVDLEVFDPNTALRLRFRLAESDPARAPTLQGQMEQQAMNTLIHSRAEQIKAVQSGFNEILKQDNDFLTLLSSFSPFELMVIFEAPHITSMLTMQDVTAALSFHDFPENLPTQEHLLKFCSTLSDMGRRLFVFTATSRVSLNKGEYISVHCQQMEQMMDMNTFEILQAEPLQRTFASQLELAPLLTYDTVANAVRGITGSTRAEMSFNDDDDDDEQEQDQQEEEEHDTQ